MAIVGPITPNTMASPALTNPAAIGPSAPHAPSASGLTSHGAGASGSGTNTSDFPGLLKDLLGQLNTVAQTADASATAAATGQDVDLHELMMKMESASLGFDLGVQVRNRLMEAY